MPARIMEKFKPFVPDREYFPAVPSFPYCTRSGKIPGDDVVPTGEDICWAYKLVEELPDTSIFPQRICIPSIRLGSFQAGEVLLAKQTEDAISWVRLPTPTKGVGIATEITCVFNASGSEVRLRWKDPEDVGVYVWKKTRILKKAGSFPANENDGIIVVESTERNQYYDDELIDHVPVNISTNWYYKVFTYSVDGVVTTSDECRVQPRSPSWSDMSEQIQAGLAQQIFHIGDEITVTNGVQSMTFVVDGFDQIESSVPNKRRSVTLTSKTPVVTGLVFDKEHPKYVLVEDEIAPVKGLKTYYQYNTSREDYVIVPVPTGTHITAADGYYVREQDEDSTKYGCNDWGKSSGRKYLNGEWLNTKLSVLDSDFTQLILDTYKSLFDTTIDKVRLLSIEQMESSAVSGIIGWSIDPVDTTTYSVWYKKTNGVTIRTDADYANEAKNSHVVIYIG